MSCSAAVMNQMADRDAIACIILLFALTVAFVWALEEWEAR